MRLRRQSWRGITRYQSPDPVSIDFDALGPGLIAFVGANGEGKTTAAEIPMAAIDKSFPTRPGSLYDRCHGRDAFMEAVFADGPDDVTVRLAIDAVAKKTEGYVLRNGEPVTDGKAAGFDALTVERFGSRSLRLASIFAAQDKKGNFLVMPKSDRKGIFLELLNLGALEILAEQARARAGTARAALEKARDRAAEIERQAADLADAPERLAEAQTAADGAAKRVETTRIEEAAALAALERARAQAARVDELRAIEIRARDASMAAAKAVDEAESRGPRALSRRDERLKFLDARKVGGLEVAARKRHTVETNRILGEIADVHARLLSVPDLAAAEEKHRNATSARAQAENLAAQIRGADQGIRDAKAAWDSATRDHARVVDAFNAETRRLTNQAARMDQVPCTSAGKWWADYEQPENPATKKPASLSATCPLLADARSAQSTLEDLTAPDGTAVDAASAAHEAATIARNGLGDAPDPRSFDAEVQAAVEEMTRAKSGDGLRERLASLEAQRTTADAALHEDLADAARAVTEAEAERKRIGEDYEAEIVEAASAVAAAQVGLEEARAAHSTAQDATNAAASVDLQAAERSHANAQRDRQTSEFAMREADQSLARAQAQSDRLGQLAPLRSSAAADVAQKEVAVGDWGMLEKALGREGVQALEVDAAGPEVARITNDLLEACYGPRFSLTFETLAEKKDGGMKEVFDVRVYDGGAERPVEDLSGGEKVVVGEALSLAIAIYNARKNSVRFETLWRDETAGALDPENAQAYVRMLRRARELGGFHQVIFVSHQPEVWEAADAVLRVEGGRVEVRAAA